MLNYNDKDFVNVGSGKEISIKELAEMVQNIVGFNGSLKFDKSKPDGTPRKLMDISRISKLGWDHKIELQEGIQSAYLDANSNGLLDH